MNQGVRLQTQTNRHAGREKERERGSRPADQYGSSLSWATNPSLTGHEGRTVPKY